MSAPNVVIRFNELRFSEAEIKELVDIMRPYSEIHASKEYTFSVDLPTVLTVVIALYASYFAKGFFTKVGEKLGEEVGSDAVKAYRKLKEAIADLLSRKAGAGSSVLRFELVSDHAPFDIHAKVESSSEEELQRAFDALERLAMIAEEDAREIMKTKAETVVEIHYRYQPDSVSWVMAYALTENGRILRFAPNGE